MKLKSQWLFKLCNKFHISSAKIFAFKIEPKFKLGTSILPTITNRRKPVCQLIFSKGGFISS